jgi:hypothetical protein
MSWTILCHNIIYITIRYSDWMPSLWDLTCPVVHPTINGFLAWTCQNATRNHGDDFCTLKLCDMQPYELLHPNLETKVYCVLGSQEESKTMNGGMQTVCAKFWFALFCQLMASLPRLLTWHMAPSLLIGIQRCAHWVQWPSITITFMTITSSEKRWILIGLRTQASDR